MIFDIDSEANEELKQAITMVVNDAISAAMRAGMTGADAGVKIHVQLLTKGDSAGKTLLMPRYKYKTNIKIGENYEAGKGQLDSKTGLYRDEEGYWHQQMLDEQTSMV